MDLALHHVSALDVDPLTLIDLAADNGCTGVCLFTNTPRLPWSEGDADLGWPRVTREMLPAVRHRLAARGVAMTNAEYFPIVEGIDLDSYREGLDVARQLGAKLLVTPILDDDLDRAAAKLGAFGLLAAEYGLRPAVEFMPLFPACPTIQAAVAIIRASKATNVGIAVDALHLERSGGTPADVAAVDPSLIFYSQICDGPRGQSADYYAEALNRQVAGTGDFPLRELARALPKHTAFDIETPQAALAEQGV